MSVLWRPNWKFFSLFLFLDVFSTLVLVCIWFGIYSFISFPFAVLGKMGVHLSESGKCFIFNRNVLWHIILLSIYHHVVLRYAFLAERFSEARVKEVSSWSCDNPKLNLNHADKSKYKTNSKMWSGFACVSFVYKIKFWQEMENQKIILKRILITPKFEYFNLFSFDPL